MNNASLRQQEAYKRNASRNSQTEKEKYAQKVSVQTQGTGSIYTGGGEGQNPHKSTVPLGKYVS